MHLPPDTARLQFAPLSATDAPFILKLVNEPGWIAGIGDRQIHTLEAAAAYVESGPAASYARHGFGLYRLSMNASGEPVGIAGLIRRDSLPLPDLGYALLSRHSGQGLASEAARAILTFAANRLGLPTLLAITTTQNVASIRVLEKCGFVPDGILALPGDGTEGRQFRWHSPA
jgi:RimJ/RimL family protein N-acetyltransferase